MELYIMYIKPIIIGVIKKKLTSTNNSLLSATILS